MEHQGDVCAKLSYQNFACMSYNFVFKVTWKFWTAYFNAHNQTGISYIQGVRVLLPKSTMSLYLSKATPPWQNSSIKLTVNGHLKYKLHKGMNFFCLAHICVHCLWDSSEKHVLKRRREQREREGRREEKQEENRGEWMLPLPQALWHFFVLKAP